MIWNFTKDVLVAVLVAIALTFVIELVIYYVTRRM
jgi:hypothetical protein